MRLTDVWIAIAIVKYNIVCLFCPARRVDIGDDTFVVLGSLSLEVRLNLISDLVERR